MKDFMNPLKRFHLVTTIHMRAPGWTNRNEVEGLHMYSLDFIEIVITNETVTLPTEAAVDRSRHKTIYLSGTLEITQKTSCLVQRKLFCGGT